MINIEGQLEHIIYHNPSNHFTVARLRVRSTHSLISITGTMPNPTIGENLTIHGQWQSHPKYGQQLQIQSFESVLPSSINGIRTYLTSGAVKGVGSKTAKRIIEQFGSQTLHIIENDPHKLIQIKGIGLKTAETIAQDWKKNQVARQLMTFLQANGIQPAYSARILKAYGTDALSVLKDEPYRLVSDLADIGFIIADTLAQNQGLASDDPHRVKACLLYLMDQTVADGNLWQEEDRLQQTCFEQFHIDPEQTADMLNQMVDHQELVRHQFEAPVSSTVIYPPLLYEAETAIARRLHAMQTVPMNFPAIATKFIDDHILNQMAIQLSPPQMNILVNLLHHRVAVITGGPGTGKTTLIRAITVLFEKLGCKTVLATPTGRAARRLAQVTNRKTFTLHRLLGFNFASGYFEYDENNPLSADVIIIDEASMMDALLTYYLVKAVRLKAVLIFVGDVFQLPPVGPGNILADMIKSGLIPIFELSQIFRQASESNIIVNAHRIRNGESLQFDDAAQQNNLPEFYFIQDSDPNNAAKHVVEICIQQISSQHNLHPVYDIQVLTPMHRGAVGTINLNHLMQATLNPRGSTPTSKSRFRTGDKVMHLKNNYQKEVFNGDIGIVQTVDGDKSELSVDYDGRMVFYEFDELEELSLAYAISVHKSQGSEYPAVIMPLTTQHYPLLQRNLLYTAITRAKKVAVLIGSPKALEIALTNDKPHQRQTGLAQFLQSNIAASK